MPSPSQNPRHPSRWLAAICVASMLACSNEEKPTPPAQLLPAEINLARTHLDAHRADLALAILATQPDHPETQNLLESTRWHQPAGHFEHPGCEIHHIALHGDSLWAALTHAQFRTIIRWDLASIEIKAVLFPTHAPFHHFILSPTASHAVVTRGEISLLIDAQTLQPIRELGSIPADITPESNIVFNLPSTLLAHPADGAWHIRDAATGEAIRHIHHGEIPPARILAAHLDLQRLRLINEHGTRIDIPISPVEPITTHPFDEESLEILHAHLIHDGNTALIIRDLGPHEPPAAIEFDLTETPGDAGFDIDAWAARQNHSALPGLANGLLRHLAPPPVELTPTAVKFHGHPQAPILTDSPPTAFTAHPATSLLAVAEASGRITLHQPIEPPSPPTPQALTLIARHKYDPAAATLSRRDILSQSVIGAFAPDSPLHQRLLAAAADTPDADTPANALARAFRETDTAALIDILASENDLPPTLRTLATSHVHLHQNRSAAAFAPYHDGFPDIAAIRQREDWHGWEKPDLQDAVDTIEIAYHTLIADLTIDPEADETTRHRAIARLLEPTTIDVLGRRRYAIACLDAAQALIAIAGEAEHAFTFATLARYHGAPAAACMRIEAYALIALDKFADAHTRWIHIITEYPMTDHLPDDYTEAAYTAFENDDPRQSIEILITGVHRFGHDADFALRAAWLALLTGHPGQARAFLIKGQAAGFPEDSIEHATALFTIAAALDHDAPAANAHFQDLIAIDPTWADPDTLESLPWPEHLVAPLRSLTWITQR